MCWNILLKKKSKREIKKERKEIKKKDFGDRKRKRSKEMAKQEA